MHWNVSPLVLVALVLACAQPDATASDPTSSLPEWSLEQVARIGSLNDPNQSLTRVGHAIISGDGSLFVTQPEDGNIRVHDVSGRLTNTIGRPGQGPGEFRSLGPIGFLGDTLYASDGGRLSFFTLDGRFIATVPWTPPMFGSDAAFFTPMEPQDLVLLPDHSSVVRPGVEEPEAGELNTGVHVGRLRTPILRVNSDAVITDTIAWEEVRPAIAIVPRGGKTFFMPSPFSDGPLLQLMPAGEGVLVVDRSVARVTGGKPTFLIAMVRAAGDTVLSNSLSYAPRPMSDADVIRMLRQQPIYPSDDADPPSVEEFAATFRQANHVPNAHIPVTAIAIGQDGAIWLMREVTESASATWLILDKRGEPLAHATLPATQRVIAASADHLAALEHDSLDVAYIVRYRIQR